MRQWRISVNQFRFGFVVLVVLVMTQFIALAFGQTPTEVRELSLNQPVGRALKGGETHVYHINLKAGQFMHAEVNQSAGFDVIVSLYAPDGKLLVEMNAKNGYLWREAVSCIAAADGAYRLEVKTVLPNAIAGSYQIKVAELRNPTAADGKRVTAESAFSNGRNLYLQKEPSLPDVIKQYDTALGLWREIGDRYWEAVTLTNLGWAQSDLNQNDKAIDLLNQALIVFQEIKDRAGEVKAINGLGSVYSDLKQYDKAQVYYEQALTIRRELKDRRGEGVTLVNLGGVYQNLGKYDKALDDYEQGIVIAREVKNQVGEATTLVKAAVIYTSMKKLDKVKEYLEQALVIDKELNDRRGMRNMLNLLGLYYKEYFGQYEKARGYFDQTLDLNRELQDKKGESDTLVHLGMTYLAEQNNCDKAREDFEQALVIKRSLKNVDRDDESRVLGNLASAYICLGENGKARDFSEQALAIKKESKDKAGQIFLLTGLGTSYGNSGQQEKARGYYEQALAIAREEKQKVHEILVLGMLANSYKPHHNMKRHGIYMRRHYRLPKILKIIL